MKTSTLDDLYRMTAYVYGEQNAIRPVATTFSHFVEVCGMLTILDRRKKKEGLDIIDALCKALGWYFPLLAKLRVRSVEELVFRKFPYACPYCRRTPHEDRFCKTIKGTDSTVNHDALRNLYETNSSKRPKSLDRWQQMFQDIYPRTMDDKARSTLGLFEELGELAEAVRVFERYPKYFAGEAADNFSYLMGVANEFSLRAEQDNGTRFNLHDEYLKRFPGLCLACGHRVCVCPSIPRATVGRMAKELDIDPAENLFESSADSMIQKGRAAAQSVLEEFGGIPKILERFPADRGDANNAIIILLLKLASEIAKKQPDLSERFHAAAIELGASVSEAGSQLPTGYLATHGPLMTAVRDAWRATQPIEGSAPGLEKGSLAFSLGTALARVRILVVHASPTDASTIRVTGEVRAIREAIRMAGRQDKIEIDDLPSATTDDLRRALLNKEYEIVHFSSHADSNSIVLETDQGTSSVVQLSALAELIQRHKSVRCVVLNSCKSLKKITVPIGPVTVGMEETIEDASAIQFAIGFYDAIALGKEIEFAVEEGQSAVNLKGMPLPGVKIIR